MTVFSFSEDLRTSAALGLAQIVIWGGSFFSLAVIAHPIINETGWTSGFVYGCYALAIFLSGIISPFVGRTIARQGGRGMLLTSVVLTATGLIVVGLGREKVVFVVGWMVIGLGMGTGLYDALFSSLGKIYGERSRQIITQITLISGFSMTVTWPVMAWLAHSVGWRNALFIYAVVSVVITVPLYLRYLTDTPVKKAVNQEFSVRSPVGVSGILSPQTYYSMMVTFTLGSAIMTIISVQLIPVLQGIGLTAEKAITVAALIGPCQVGSRVIELLFLRKSHPKWSTLLATVLVLAGLCLLMASPTLALLAVIVYGAGGGLRTVVRGTLPMVVYGPEIYPVVMGKLARPVLIVQSLSPVLVAFFLDHFSAQSVLYVLVSIATLHFLACLYLIISLRKKAQATLVEVEACPD